MKSDLVNCTKMTVCKFACSDHNINRTLITDKLIKLLYNFLSESDQTSPATPTVVQPDRVAVVDPECVGVENILGRTQAWVLIII